MVSNIRQSKYVKRVLFYGKGHILFFLCLLRVQVPYLIQIVIEKARLLMSAGRYEKVPEMLLPVTVCSNRDMAEFAHRLLIGCAIMKGDGRQAVKFARNALGAGFNTIFIHKYTALAYEEAGLYHSALKHINISLKEDPHDGNSHMVKARIAFNDSRYPLAMEKPFMPRRLPKNAGHLFLMWKLMISWICGWDKAKRIFPHSLMLSVSTGLLCSLSTRLTLLAAAAGTTRILPLPRQ